MVIVFSFLVVSQGCFINDDEETYGDRDVPMSSYNHQFRKEYTMNTVAKLVLILVVMAEIGYVYIGM